MQKKYSKLFRETKRQAKIRATKEVQQELNEANKTIKKLKDLIVQKDQKLQEKTTQLNQFLSQKKMTKDAVSREREQILSEYRANGYSSELTTRCEKYIRNCNKYFDLPIIPNPHFDVRVRVYSISKYG